MVHKWIIKSITAINANNRPGEIAAAITIGLMLGLIPAGNITWFVLFGMTLFLKINFGMEMIVLAIVKPFAHLLDPFFDVIGYNILTTKSLEGIFTQWYNTPIVPYTGFNNTAVVGSIIAMIILFIPLWFLFRTLINQYRAGVRDRILASALVKKIKTLPVICQIVNLVSKANEFKNS